MTLDDPDDGCYVISLVEDPAVDVDFLKFSKNKSQVCASKCFKSQVCASKCFKSKKMWFEENDKHIVTGIAMRADYPIYRNQDGEEFCIVFSKEVIRDMVERFFKEGLEKAISIDHSQNIDDCVVIESYFIDKERGICPKEFTEIEDGSWIVSVKINNEDIWNRIKKGDFKGFSIETLGHMVEMYKKDDVSQIKMNLKDLMEIFK